MQLSNQKPDAVFSFLIFSVIIILIGCSNHQVESEPADLQNRWWKGNLHTHSLWSDGDHFPEVITRWYKENGYHFLSVSDHNILQQGESWIQPEYNHHAQSGGGIAVYEQYLTEFGDAWVESRMVNDTLEVRLKPLNEYRHLFEEPEKFMLINSEEITDVHVVHVNAHNILQYIPPQGGETVRETIQNNVNAVHHHHHETGQEMFPHLNHPNFHFAVTAEDLAHIEGLHFFEVYNGHRGVYNYGDENHVDLDRFWDITLTLRLAHLDLGIMYGLAVDDSHHYEDSMDETATPGRGWVMVRSNFLTPEHIIRSLKAGDFYSTTGVKLRNFGVIDGEYIIEIDAEPGVDYTVQFIGTPKIHDISSRPVVDENGNELRATRIYSEEIGNVFSEMSGTMAAYRLTGDELYVRAKIISSKAHPNPFAEGDTEVAWTQPYFVE